MRFTPNKLRNLLLESNYRLPKGYSVVKRKRSLSGNMALSFLSGDASGTGIESVEARAKAMYAKKQLEKAEDRLDELEEYDELGFIGLDEIGSMKQATSNQPQKRMKRIKKDNKPTPDPVINTEQNAPTPALPAAAKRATSSVKSMVTTPVSVQSKAAAPAQSKAKAPAPLVSTDRETANVSLETAKQQVQEARDAARTASEEVATVEAPKSFFAGKNLIIIGALAVAALGGLYFFSKKK
jgi:BRCT domain type II-containing protein